MFGVPYSLPCQKQLMRVWLCGASAAITDGNSVIVVPALIGVDNFHIDFI